MSLTEQDYRYVRQRRKLNSSWPLAGGVSLFVLLVTYAWLSMSYPQIANPVFVYNALHNNQMAFDTIQSLAMLAPVFLSMIFILTGAMLGFGFAIMRQEKRLIDIIDRLVSGSE